MGRPKIIRTKQELLERRKLLNERSRIWRLNNPEKTKEINKRSNQKKFIRMSELKKSLSEDELAEIREKQRKYYSNYRQKNNHKIILASRKYRQKNPEKSREATRRWREKNIEKRKIYDLLHKSKPEIKEKRNKRRNKKLKTCPKFLVETRLRNRTAAAFRLLGYRKNCKTSKTLGAEWHQVKDHIESLFKDGMNWENKSEWEIDHIIPLASAVSEEHLISLFHYTNLQPLWKQENRSKGCKVTQENLRIFKERRQLLEA
jgi:hypothetical protein